MNSEQQSLVLDASALLALGLGEPGGATVEGLLHRSVISSVNWSEVMQRTIARNLRVEGLGERYEAVGLLIQPFTTEDADIVAHLWTFTRHLGLSLADRACLALALRSGLPLLTADRIWSRIELPIDIRLLR